MTTPGMIVEEKLEALIRSALEEDIGTGDITSEALVGEHERARASIVSRGDYVICGEHLVESVFTTVSPDVVVTVLARDGERVQSNQHVVHVEGDARSMLAAERTALNFLQRLSGIATTTAGFVERVRKHPAMILDTRKTTPGLRELEKYAVRCGGGHNHRMGLYDRILIKDNHLNLWKRPGSGSLGDAVRQARSAFPDTVIEVEVESEEDFESVLPAEPDWVLLDNMDRERLVWFVRKADGRCKLEASGCVTLDTVAGIAASGVDAISVGALTHSAAAADFSLEFGGLDG